MKGKPDIWVFDDGRAGTFNQALAVAEALPFPFVIKKIEYTPFAKLPNFIRGSGKIGISEKTIKALLKDREKLPDIIITAGRRCAPLARHIRKLSRGKTQIVQIMYPGRIGLSDFALVVIPGHDNLGIASKENVLEITGAPHRISEKVLRDATKKWHKIFAKYPRPITAVIVGGSTKNRTFTDAMAQELTSGINKLIGRESKERKGEKGKGTILLTTSRRTGTSQENIITENLPDAKYIYKWGDKGENPYFGFLALADRIVVTGDSVSMCSEACSTSVPVYIYDNPKLITKKHRRFLDELYSQGRARPLSLTLEQASEECACRILNPACQIAKRVEAIVLKQSEEEKGK